MSRYHNHRKHFFGSSGSEDREMSLPSWGVRSGFLLPDLNFLPEPVGPFGPLARILLGLPEACRRLTALQLSLLVEYPEDLDPCFLGDVALEGNVGGVNSPFPCQYNHHLGGDLFRVVRRREPHSHRVATTRGDVLHSRDFFDESITLLVRPPSRSHVDTVCVFVYDHAGLAGLGHMYLSVQIVNARTIRTD